MILYFGVNFYLILYYSVPSIKLESTTQSKIKCRLISRYYLLMFIVNIFLDSFHSQESLDVFFVLFSKEGAFLVPNRLVSSI